MKRILTALALGAIAVTLGLNLGLTPEDCTRIMATPEYQQQEIEYRRSL